MRHGRRRNPSGVSVSSSVSPGSTLIASRTWAGRVTWRFEVILTIMAYSCALRRQQSKLCSELACLTRFDHSKSGGHVGSEQFWYGSGVSVSQPGSSDFRRIQMSRLGNLNLDLRIRKAVSCVRGRLRSRALGDDFEPATIGGYTAISEETGEVCCSIGGVR